MRRTLGGVFLQPTRHTRGDHDMPGLLLPEGSVWMAYPPKVDGAESTPFFVRNIRVTVTGPGGRRTRQMIGLGIEPRDGHAPPVVCR